MYMNPGFDFFNRVVGMAESLFGALTQFFNGLSEPIARLFPADSWVSGLASFIFGLFGVDITMVTLFEFFLTIGLSTIVIVHIVKLFNPVS